MGRLLHPIGLALVTGAGLLLAVNGWAGDRGASAEDPGADSTIPSVTFPQAVDLDASTLARLRVTNPNHYARAKRILTDDPPRPTADR